MLDKISPQMRMFLLFLLVAAISGAIMYTLLGGK